MVDITKDKVHCINLTIGIEKLLKASIPAYGSSQYKQGINDAIKIVEDYFNKESN